MGPVLMLGGVARRLWALTAWRLAIAVWCRRITVSGQGNVPTRPVVVIANHASHADTVLIQYALATCHRRPVLVAGAEDYWFRNPVLGTLARMLGVMAFPRRGELGILRTYRALASEATVVLFPQGSRSGGHFRDGVGRIARRLDTPVLPVHLAGTATVLPKGRHWPRRGDVSVRFGAPVVKRPGESAAAFAARLEHIVLDELGAA